MGEGEKAPVFFDPKGRRRVILRLILWLFGSAAMAITGCFLFSILATPVLPDLSDSLGIGRIRPAAMLGTFPKAVSRLEGIKSCHGVVCKGEGEVPRSKTITRWGQAAEKLIALTFDDGPSRKFTPEILRILREKNAKATFFVVGANAALEPDILREIYADGHDIGNHTFTHPDLTAVPAAQLDLELNATQRVIESKLGVRTVLFRPPFGKGIEPDTRDQGRTLAATAAMGYIAIGLGINSTDWEQPGAPEIVRRTIEHATAQRGNIVLLHDAGGDRSQTVEALPQIIDELRARGFRLVTISELLGLSRDEVMPPLADHDRLISWINDVGFSLARQLGTALGILFVVGLVLGTARLVLVAVAAWAQSRRESERAALVWEPRSLAVIVPAYNEEKVICDCIASLLRSHGPAFDIVIVDDGSTDGTERAVTAAFAGNPRVKLYRKPNDGKASALNWGIAKSNAEIVVAIDADTRLDSNAIPRLVRHFADPAIGAVAGAVYVGNASRLLTRFQAVEYITSQNLDRRALEIVNGIVVVPGAIGAWRRSAVTAAGGYETDTLAEDADLTLKLERAGWRVIHEPGAFADTEAPETIDQFLKQRFRWMFGTLQMAFKNLRCLRGISAVGVMCFALPNVLLFQFLFALIAPVIDFALVLSLATDAWGYFTKPAAELSARTRHILAYWLALNTLEVAAGALAFHLDRRGPRWSLLPLILLQRFCYRQLIYWVAFKSTAAAIRGSVMTWGKLQRRGMGERGTGHHSGSAARLPLPAPSFRPANSNRLSIPMQTRTSQRPVRPVKTRA